MDNYPDNNDVCKPPLVFKREKTSSPREKRRAFFFPSFLSLPFVIYKRQWIVRPCYFPELHSECNAKTHCTRRYENLIFEICRYVSPKTERIHINQTNKDNSSIDYLICILLKQERFNITYVCIFLYDRILFSLSVYHASCSKITVSIPHLMRQNRKKPVKIFSNVTVVMRKRV